MPTDADREFGEIALKNELITKKQHSEALKALGRLKGKMKGKKKKPRLVDLLVQKEYMTGSEAKTVEKARQYRAARREDKLYGRIALKSKFCKSKHVDKGLKAQKDSYLEGEDPVRLAAYLLGKNFLTEEEDEAIQDAMGKLDVVEYMAGRKPKSKRVPVEDDDDDLDDLDDDDLEELDPDELEELDDDLELDLDADDDDDDDAKIGLDDEDDAQEIDSQIESALSGFDDLDLDDDEGLVPDSPPHGLSSDDDSDGEDDLDLDDLDDDDDDLGSDDLGSDDLDLDSDDDDDDDLDLDDDSDLD